MKNKYTILIVIFILISSGIDAQVRFRKPLKSSQEKQTGFSDYNIGLKVGCPWSILHNPELSKSVYDGHFGYLAGIVVERKFSRFSVALEGTFAQKGTKMHNVRDYQISLSQTGTLRTELSTAYNVITIRVPFIYYLNKLSGNSKMLPYVFVGPEVDLPSPVNIRFTEGTFSVDSLSTLSVSYGENTLPVTTTFKPMINVSAVVGAGTVFQIPTVGSNLLLKVDAAVNLGQLNQTTTADVRLFGHSLELSVSLLFPIKKRLLDGCYYLSK